VESDEANTLLEILEKYELHLKENENSLLVRFLGLHSLKMYNRIFSFVVMRNIFPPLATINQRYDIKGSWVNRNSAPVPPGVRVFCRHCGDLFVSGSQTSCPDLVGEHEANFVLKDNDFTSKIRLRPDDAYNLIDVLNKDSDALCAMGITDYSLLIGIRNLQYEVEPGRIISQRRKSTLQSISDTGTSMDMKRSEDFSTLVSPPPSLMRSQSLSSSDPQHQHRLLMKKNITSKNASSTSAKKKDVTITEHTENITFVDYDHNKDENNCQMLDLMEEELTGGYLARSVIAPGVYYMGAVDILQKWTIRKRIERLYKIYVLGRSGAGLSCMAPEPYKVRFQQKVSQIIEHSIFIREITGSWKGKRELTEPTTLINA
jgi:1-phosphatidylinositol-4-phosphate 5-kinase